MCINVSSHRFSKLDVDITCHLTLGVPRNVGSVAGWGCHHWVWDVTGICQGYRPHVPSGAATGEVREAAAEYSFDSSLDDEDSNGGCLTIGSLRGWKNVL